jgi:DNA-3-methyladenine glycosylase
MPNPPLPATLWFSPLTTNLFLQETVIVARFLLGQYVVRRWESQVIAVGRIVETEAYTSDDPACHAFRRKTQANAPMFGRPGTAYIHINYGIHFCLNVVTQPEGTAEAVLIRAIEPIFGAEWMYQNYTGEILSEDEARQARILGAGPGRLTRALQIERSLNGTDLTLPESPVSLAVGESVSSENIVTTTRIGITKAVDYPWRFYDKTSRFISRK